MTAVALAIAVAALGLAIIAIIQRHADNTTRRREYRQLRAAIKTAQRKRELDEHLIPTNGKARHP